MLRNRPLSTAGLLTPFWNRFALVGPSETQLPAAPSGVEPGCACFAATPRVISCWLNSGVIGPFRRDFIHSARPRGFSAASPSGSLLSADSGVTRLLYAVSSICWAAAGRPLATARNASALADRAIQTLVLVIVQN